jgi:peptidoglycan hydrolase CwlO-like protein
MFFSFFSENKKWKGLMLLMITGILLPVIFVFSASLSDLDAMCGNEEWKEACNTVSDSECQNLLNQCQTYFEAKRKDVESDMTKTSEEKKTLQTQISSLNKKIKDLDYQIYQSNLSIKSLGFQINDTETSIVETEKEIVSQKEKIGLILRAVADEDKKSFVEVLIASKTISEFFDNLVYLETLSVKNQDLLSHFENLEASLKGQQVSLGEEKGEKESLLELQSVQKKESSSTKKEKDKLYTLTETQYQAQLKAKEEIEKKATEIAKKLIQITGLADDQKAPSFGEALEIAKQIGNSIGVRPAFLLAIISQESAIGRNVGQCYITNKETGGGKYSNGKLVNRIVHPTRDLPVFLDIINNSGRVMEKTPVSCWINDCVSKYGGTYFHCKATVAQNGEIICAKSGYVAFGFGGAMGPAQFIPSTWDIYDQKVMAVTGKSVADPWNIKDAFTAAGLYLKDLGGGKTSGEYSAASRYYGGSSAYAKSVSTRAWCIQEFTDKGSMSDYCQGLIF